MESYSSRYLPRVSRSAYNSMIKISTKTIIHVFLAWMLFFDVLMLRSDLLTIVARWIIGGSFLLIVPGWLILTSLRLSKTLSWDVSVYAVGLSTSFLMSAGLIYNYLGPLNTAHIALALNIAIIFLVYVAYKYGNSDTQVHLTAFSRTDILATFIATFLPILTLVGTVILNNGGPGFITIGMILLSCALISLVVIFRKHITLGLYP